MEHLVARVSEQKIRIIDTRFLDSSRLLIYKMYFYIIITILTVFRVLKCLSLVFYVVQRSLKSQLIQHQKKSHIHVGENNSGSVGIDLVAAINFLSLCIGKPMKKSTLNRWRTWCQTRNQQRTIIDRRFLRTQASHVQNFFQIYAVLTSYPLFS